MAGQLGRDKGQHEESFPALLEKTVKTCPPCDTFFYLCYAKTAAWLWEGELEKME